jgi:soluble lytic murein transglycosylase-like protein
MNRYTISTLVVYVGMLGCLAVMAPTTKKPAPQNPPIAVQEPRSDLEKRLARYVGDEQLAEVLAKTKYPKTLAAIAKVESDFDPHAVGDSGKSIGMYQIQPRLHGPVPKSIQGQTRKAEQLLDKLVKTKGYYLAIARYNGDGPKAEEYRRKVMTELRKI